MKKIVYEIKRNNTTVATETSYQRVLDICRDRNYTYSTRVEEIKEPLCCTKKQLEMRVKC